MTSERNERKRIVVAPSAGGSMEAGDILHVEVGHDEEVEWIWSHDRVRGSRVTGYNVVKRLPGRRQGAVTA